MTPWTRITAAAAAMALLGLGPLARGQESITDLEGKNARRLDAAELKMLLADARVEYRSLRSIDYNWENRADGTIANGHAVMSRIQGIIPGQGSWQISPRGTYCVDSTYGRSQPFDLKYCAWIYKLEDRYFLVIPPNPDGKAVPLSVKPL